MKRTKIIYGFEPLRVMIEYGSNCLESDYKACKRKKECLMQMCVSDEVRAFLKKPYYVSLTEKERLLMGKREAVWRKEMFKRCRRLIFTKELQEVRRKPAEKE